MLQLWVVCHLFKKTKKKKLPVGMWIRYLKCHKVCKKKKKIGQFFSKSLAFELRPAGPS